MAKRLRDYVKYTTKELDKYTQTEGSCVRKVNTNLHLSIAPFCLADFKSSLMNQIVRTKVGYYDAHLDAIILDVKQIKVLGTTGDIRADDAMIHVNINADVYVFKPEEGAELIGLVKHIGQHQVGVILYRVFNANVKVVNKVDKREVQMDQEVKFRIRKFNLQNRYPYIEGELLTAANEQQLSKAKRTVFKMEDNADSGIEERDGGQELDQLLSIIKEETPSEYGETPHESKKKKSSKKQSKTVKEEIPDDDSLTSANKKPSKKRKSSNSLNDDDNLASPTKKLKKVKKEKPESPAKKRKRKTNISEQDDITDDDFITSS